MQRRNVAKRQLREKMLQQCRSLSPPEREAAGRAVAGRLESMPEFARARRVGLYVALADELPTRRVAECVRASGRSVLLPRMVGARLEFAVVGEAAPLRRGRFGVLEPTEAAAPVAWAGDDLLLVPGLAFDHRGGRLGRGGGYYDRSLPCGRPKPAVFGIAFDFQVVDEVPLASHDRRVDGVVTPGGVVRAKSGDPPDDPG